jgi:hypothetical protein
MLLHCGFNYSDFTTPGDEIISQFKGKAIFEISYE